MTARAKAARTVAKPATAAEPAAGAVPQTRYYDPNVTWAAGQGEQDQPVPAHEAAEPAASAQVDGQSTVDDHDAAPPGHRDWKMTPAGMVAAGRPAVPPGGEQAPAGGGQRGRDFVTSPGGPPVPAGEQAAAAARAPWPRSTSN